jgi:hypothetical protein
VTNRSAGEHQAIRGGGPVPQERRCAPSTPRNEGGFSCGGPENSTVEARPLWECLPHGARGLSTIKSENACPPSAPPSGMLAGARFARGSEEYPERGVGAGPVALRADVALAQSTHHDDLHVHDDFWSMRANVLGRLADMMEPA